MSTRELLEGAISDIERVRDVRMWRKLNGELAWRGVTPDGNEIETEHPHALLESALGQLRTALAGETVLGAGDNRRTG